MATKLNWGIIACGRIAGKFANSLKASKTGQLVAAASRTLDKAEKFVAEYGGKPYGSYEELLADDNVQAVYIATPHPSHPEWCIKAAEAGKHILCEKPIAINHAEAMQAVEAAVRHDVFLMEAFMYRCHPQIAKVVELVKEGAIGEVRMIRAAFGFNAGYNPEGRLFANALGGGGILDVGCYAVSMSRLVAGAALGKEAVDPIEVKAVGQLTETDVDGVAAAVLKFEGNIVAQVSTAVQASLENDVRIIGSDGWIHIPKPWIPPADQKASITVKLKDEKESKTIEFEICDLYGSEADVVAEHLDARQAPSPAMTLNDTLGNMKTLDQWRESMGQQYEVEKPEKLLHTASGRTLAVHDDSKMKYGELPGVEKKISRLVMGVDNQRTITHASAIFDDYFERGGNAFDTAYIYCGGKAEKLLGQWVRNRGVREQVVILDKCNHTPNNQPEKFLPMLTESLERLGTEYIDIHMPHRDNPDIPVKEWMDVFNEAVAAGRVKALGASNWTAERVQEANDYAKEKGLVGLCAVSNQYSLARMLEPPWKGCLSSKQDAEWLASSGIALMPWSSQARGFFTGIADPNDKSNKELVRCWYCDDNFERLKRAEELAAKKGIPTITLAAAWVLAQPFQTFPLIGPRLISETRTSFQSLDVELTPDEVKWLDLQD